jgi:hypothetical protein
MANNSGAVTSPRLANQEQANMGQSINFIPNQR